MGKFYDQNRWHLSTVLLIFAFSDGLCSSSLVATVYPKHSLLTTVLTVTLATISDSVLVGSGNLDVLDQPVSRI